MRQYTRFANGPFTAIETQRHAGADWLVMDTDVSRLLSWGKAPRGSNANNQVRLTDAVKSIPSSLKFFGADAKTIFTLTGWAEGLRLAKKYACEMPAMTLPSIARRPVWSEEGDDFSRDRFDAGYADCWRGRRRSLKPSRPTLKLTVGIGGNSKVSASALVWGGVAATAIADAAEAAGYRLEIEAQSARHHPFDEDYELCCIERIAVKQADETLSPETLVMALACPYFFRWYVMHSTLAACPDLHACHTYGRSVDSPVSLHGDLHLPACHDAYSARNAVDAILAKISEMAGETAAT